MFGGICFIIGHVLHHTLLETLHLEVTKLYKSLSVTETWINCCDCIRYWCSQS